MRTCVLDIEVQPSPVIQPCFELFFTSPHLWLHSPCSGQCFTHLSRVWFFLVSGVQSAFTPQQATSDGQMNSLIIHLSITRSGFSTPGIHCRVQSCSFWQKPSNGKTHFKKSFRLSFDPNDQEHELKLIFAEVGTCAYSTCRLFYLLYFCNCVI